MKNPIPRFLSTLLLVLPPAPVNNQSQNGVTQPVDGAGNGSAVCDIGAYEAPEAPTPTPAATATPTITPTTTPTTTPEDRFIFLPPVLR
ncbi:MAG: hypothetical protein NZ553_02670 [Caldilinea sp.]|nr:hypothetical protein [Caldilinea sp.]MDW8439354.1 hypothetical protein [Caldilineaceae bacterium]